MKINLLISDIQEDLKKIEKLKQEYDYFIELIGEKEPDTYQKAVIGFYLHNFYNACENIFISIAKVFENQVDEASWHKDMLKRMKLAIEDIRPPVISDDLYFLLDDFRSFRHVFRHIYSTELDWEKEKIVADKFEETLAKFKKEINSFIDYLKTF
jgi:hypothetical protein